MLYKRILYAGFIGLQFMLTRTTGGDIYVPDGANSVTCTGTTCNVYCDQSYGKSQPGTTVDCGSVSTCNIIVTGTSCLEQGTINALASGQVLTVSCQADDCFKGATFHLPPDGTATMGLTSASSGGAYEKANFYAGSNTTLDLNCSDGGSDECKASKIYGNTARFVKVAVASSAMFEGSKDAESERSWIQCPINSDYSGPYSAPCVLDATSAGAAISRTTVWAYEGTPADFVIEGTSWSDVLVYCYRNNAWISSPVAYSASSGICSRETTTKQPTKTPTKTPTKSPSKNPTISPSKSPTTRQPTKVPTKLPTKDPTRLPTDSPSYGPTKSPTNDPTNSPSKSPTALTTSPSPPPTVTPTDLPTGVTVPPSASPTTAPPTTTAPSTIPSGLPSIQPTRGPIVHHSEATVESIKSPRSNLTQLPSASPAATTTQPTDQPTRAPNTDPSLSPTLAPTPTIVKTFALSAWWSCLYSSLFIEYDDEPLLNVNALTENVCSQIFDADTANLLGDAVCWWSLTEKFITVTLSPFSTIGVTDAIAIKSGVFEGYDNGQRYTNERIEIASIGAECSETAPVVDLYIPPIIGVCDGLALDIRGNVISNLGRRRLQSIEWQITLNEPSETLSFSDRRYISLLPSQIDTNQTFFVTLTVTAWYGVSTTTTWSVFKLLLAAVPSITMLYPSVLDVYSSKDLEIDSLITFNDECIRDSNVTVPQFEYAWMVDVVSDDNETAVGAQLSELVYNNADQRLIIEDIDTLLQKGIPYAFTLTVQCGIDCQVSSQAALITYQHSPIQCQISGGDQPLSLSMNQLSQFALTLIGDEWSFDPEGSTLSYAWQCYELVNGVSCDELIESPFAALTRVMFSDIDTGFWVMDNEYQFVFTLVVSDSDNAVRSACTQSKYVTLTVTEQEVETYLVQVSSTAKSITTADRLRLLASITTLGGGAVSFDDDSELLYVWENDQLTTAQIAENRLNDANAKNLVLSGDVLTTGKTYEFVLNVYQASDLSTSLGTSSISIYVRSPPVIYDGGFVVEHDNGNTCKHQFTDLIDSLFFSFDLLVSADAYQKPLSYEFKSDNEFLHSHVLDQYYLSDVLLPIDHDLSISVTVTDFDGTQVTQSMDCSLTVEDTTNNNCFSYQTDVLAEYLNENLLLSVSAKYRYILQSSFNLVRYLPNIDDADCVSNHLQETLSALDANFGSHAIDLCASNNYVYVTGVATTLKKWLSVGLQESAFSSAESCGYFDVVYDLLTQVLDPCQTIQELVTDTNLLSVSPESVRTNRIQIFYATVDITDSLSLLLTQRNLFDLLYELINVFFDYQSTSTHCAAVDLQQNIAFLQKIIYVNGLSGISTTIPTEYTSIALNNFELLTIREEQISEVSVNVNDIAVEISVGDDDIVTDIVFYGITHEPVPNTAINGCTATDSSSSINTTCAGILGASEVSATIPNNDGSLDIAIEITFEYSPEYEPVCVWWDELSETWDTSGCYADKDEDSSTVVCVCNHLTTFATISSLRRSDIDPLDEHEPFIADLGFKNWGYIMVPFIAAFSGIFGWIFFNFWRLTTFGASIKFIFKHRGMQIMLAISLVALFYALQCLVLLISSFSFASDGSSHEQGLAALLTVFLLMPLIAYYKIFAFLVGTWINVVHSMNKSTLVRNFKKSLKCLVIVVFLVYTTLTVLLLSFSNNDKYKFVTDVIKVGELIWTVVMIILVITYTYYGARIIKTLRTQLGASQAVHNRFGNSVDDTTASALKRISAAVFGLNVFFVLQGAQTIYFSVYPDRLNIAWKYADLSLNAFCLLLMCVLYSRAFQSVLQDMDGKSRRSRRYTRTSDATNPTRTMKIAKSNTIDSKTQSVNTSSKPSCSTTGGGTPLSPGCGTPVDCDRVVTFVDVKPDVTIDIQKARHMYTRSSDLVFKEFQRLKKAAQLDLHDGEETCDTGVTGNIELQDISRAQTDVESYTRKNSESAFAEFQRIKPPKILSVESTSVDVQFDSNHKDDHSTGNKNKDDELGVVGNVTPASEKQQEQILQIRKSGICTEPLRPVNVTKTVFKQNGDEKKSMD